MKKLDVYDIADLREIARRKLPAGLFEFVDPRAGLELLHTAKIAAQH